MSNHKMKSLLKGLRYISQMFENDKEPEMEIGNPTDVKHVAHIGWDGGSANPPSWMNDFKAPAGRSSATLPDIKEDSSFKSDDSSRKGTRDLPGLPKSSKRSPTKDKSEKTKRRSLNPDGSTKASRRSKESSSQRDDSPADSSKKSRRKKSKDSANGGGGGSSRSSKRAQRSENESDCASETGSMISISEERSFP